MLSYKLKHNSAVHTDGSGTFGFNGMLKDNEIKGESNSYDFGARMYDPRIGRFLSIDPFAAKYSYLTPYHFTSDNPIKFIDYDGNDFGVYINHDTKTIVIKATYIATSKDVASATSAANRWMKQNGRFEYKVGKGKDAITYNIKYEITVKDASTMPNPGNDAEFAVRDIAHYEDKSSEINTYRQAPTNDPSLKGDNGAAVDDPNISHKGTSQITVAYGKEEERRSGAHEIGHTLGIGHWFKGLMKKGSTRTEDEVYITPGMVGQTLKTAGIGNGSTSTTDYEVEPNEGSVKTKVHSEGKSPSNFNSGKVKKAKK